MCQGWRSAATICNNIGHLVLKTDNNVKKCGHKMIATTREFPNNYFLPNPIIMNKNKIHFGQQHSQNHKHRNHTNNNKPTRINMNNDFK